jgi:hypothetical protein
MSNRYVTDRPEPADMDVDTAPCRKCHTTVRTTTERCPACGYDPSPGLFATVVFWLIALPWSILGGVVTVGIVGGVAAGALTVADAIGAAVAVAVLFGVAFWYVRRYWRRRRATVTEGSA